MIFLDILLGIIACLLFSDGAMAKPDIDAVEQSVVRVVTRLSGGTGTGFVINDTGVVVTNHHIVAGGTRFSVYPSGSNTELMAQLVGVDEQHDLAILRFKLWGAVLVMLGILSTLLALRKPRERIVRMVEQYTRKVVETVGIKTENSVPGVVLAGFDTDGKPLRLVIAGKRVGEGRGATVGRHPKMTVATIEDQSISRRQFRFSYADQTHYIEDLNSANGTRVNKVRLKPFTKTSVSPGDTIKAGNLEFTLSRH